MQKQLDLDKIEKSSDFISGYDENLHIVIWNEAIANKYKLSKADAIGKYVLDLFPHVATDDFRLLCLRQSISERKMFYFSALPYVFEEGTYSQLILPGRDHSHFSVLSVVRDHKGNELYPRTELLDAIMTPLPLVV